MNYLADCKRNGQPCVVSMSWADSGLCTHVAGMYVHGALCVSKRRDETWQTTEFTDRRMVRFQQKWREYVTYIAWEKDTYLHTISFMLWFIINVSIFITNKPNIYNLNPQYCTAKQDVNKIYRIGCVAMRIQQPTTRPVVAHAKHVRFIQV